MPVKSEAKTKTKFGVIFKSEFDHAGPRPSLLWWACGKIAAIDRRTTRGIGKSTDRQIVSAFSGKAFPHNRHKPRSTQTEFKKLRPL
jgi:hypothetical protein